MLTRWVEKEEEGTKWWMKKQNFLQRGTLHEINELGSSTAI